MRKETAGKVGTNLSGKEATTETSIERMLHPEMTARGDALEITETKAVEANLVLPRRE